MNAKGFVLIGGRTLFVGYEGKSWSIEIRRLDGKPEPSFYEFHKKDMTKEQIKAFIPNPEQLRWEEIKDELFGTELAAVDDGYRINLIRHDKNLTTEKMKEEFLELLR